jgi:hypothetical protein
MSKLNDFSFVEVIVRVGMEASNWLEAFGLER